MQMQDKVFSGRGRKSESVALSIARPYVRSSTVRQATFWNHLASFVKLESAYNKTPIDATL